jgi:hypothetical protein
MGIRCFENYGTPIRHQSRWNKQQIDSEIVYKIVDEERDYQNSINFRENCPTIAAEIIMMEDYLHKARTMWAPTNEGSTLSLHHLRVVVAMGIRCFENYGVPDRVMPNNSSHISKKQKITK